MSRRPGSKTGGGECTPGRRLTHARPHSLHARPHPRRARVPPRPSFHEVDGGRLLACLSSAALLVDADRAANARRLFTTGWPPSRAEWARLEIGAEVIYDQADLVR